jgi:hypothetical protein
MNTQRIKTLLLAAFVASLAMLGALSTGCGGAPSGDDMPPPDAAITSDATGPITGASIMALPERWFQTSPPAAQTTQAMQARVSGFDDIPMIRAGSIVGVNWRLRSMLVAGTLTINPTINGTPTSIFGMSATNGSTLGGSEVQGPGDDHYETGDTIGVVISTTSFAPTTNNLVEVWIEVMPDGAP